MGGPTLNERESSTGSPLVLGPLLRHVGSTDATIWVETSAAGSVQVRAGPIVAETRTFQVAGHHYAIVALTGLEPASSTPYDVLVDGQVVWPSDPERPPSVIRTIDPAGPIRLAFGSCREPVEPGTTRGIDPDVLVAYADRLAQGAGEGWPTALLLLGDQVYADETTPAMRDELDRRRDTSKPPGHEVANFEEYTLLYREAWSDPSIRWLFSTVPVSMIFDDHDIRDDWNTSASWRDDMAATSWWQDRIAGGLMSYWIYQHLGNLSPTGLANDETLKAVRAADDGAEILRAFALHADAEADGAKGTMWSYRRDLGRVRLVVIDSRCGRILADGRRSMISDAEFDWVERQVTDGEYDHLVVGTSLPWLLPRALHEIESWDEVLAQPRRGRLVAGIGEWLRRGADLEHWAAFRASFDRLAALFATIGRRDANRPVPATICVLSGDVHHTYVAEAAWPDPTDARVFQITCSPFHNSIPRPMKLVFHVGWSRVVETVMKGVSRLSGVPALPIHWRHPTGPHFGNALASLTFEGRTARLALERSEPQAKS
ncbi:MAG TPA: alkaline phosphatase D family protein, partial [Candidatus Limnocylindrales bacterium]|nr:alkaline phosphatase D family protein [Candidatus Limnocylindrales bacterium]